MGKSNFSIELPMNSTGLGNVGTGIVHELFRRQLTPNIFLIGNADLDATNITENFVNWLRHCTDKAMGSFKRDEPFIKLWHINGSHQKISDNSTLYTVHETDELTPVEQNIINQYSRVLVPSNYSAEIFGRSTKTGVCPNFFDASLFSKIDVPRQSMEDVTIFGIFGKLEKRKRTVQTIGAWCKKFRNDKRYRLNCHIYNPFLLQVHNIDPSKISPADALKLHVQAVEEKLGFKLPWNVEFYGFQNKDEYNMSLNACDIDLSLSGGEGFGLPSLTTRVLGKRGVVLNAHSYPDYSSTENSIFVEPDGKEDSSDGVFFVKGQPYNQGNIFRWDDDEAIAAMEKALDMPEPNEEVGAALAEKFSVSNTVDILLDF